MIFEDKKSIVRDYFVRNRVSFGLLLGSGVLIFMRPGSQKVIFIGLSVSLLGLLIRSWAAGCIKKSKYLCTGGPYAFVRHPLYLGSLLMSAGIVAVFTNTDSLWLSGIFWATYSLYFWGFYTAAVASEEKLLAERFTTEWPSYKKNVPAFFPFRLAQFKNVGPKSFSFSQYNKNKEYNAVLGWTAIAVFIFKLSPLSLPHPEVVPEMVLVSEDINKLHKPLAEAKSASHIKTVKVSSPKNEKQGHLSNPEPKISLPLLVEKMAPIKKPIDLEVNDDPLEEPRQSRKLSLVNPWFGNAILGTSALTLAGAVGYSQLSQGQNFDTEVVGGAFLGIVIGKAISYFDRKKGWSKRISSDGRSVTYKQRF